MKIFDSMKRLICFITGALALLSCAKQEIDTTPVIFQNTTIAEFNSQAADDNYYYCLLYTSDAADE